MKLPVHAKLCKYIARIPFRAGGYLLKHLRILKAHRIIAILGLRQHGEVIIGHLRMGIGALVDLMPNLMGDSPAIVLAAYIFSILSRHRHTAHHSGRLIPLNANVIACRIHKGSCKHLHITDVQIPIGQMVLIYNAAVGSLGKGIGQALVLIKQSHHAVHGLYGARKASFGIGF